MIKPGTFARLLSLAAILSVAEPAHAQEQTGTLGVTISLRGTGSWRDPNGDATTVAIDRMLEAKIAIRGDARSASDPIGQYGVPDVTEHMPSVEQQMAIAREAQACGHDAACLQEVAAKITALQQPRMAGAGGPGRYVVWGPDPLESAACLLGWTEKVDDMHRATDGNTGETVTTTVRVGRQTPSFLLPVSETPPICSALALFTIDSQNDGWTFSPVTLIGSHFQAEIANRGQETSTRTELIEPFGFHLSHELNPHLAGIDLRALVFRGSGATRGDTAISLVLGSPGEEIRAELTVSWSARLEAEKEDIRIAIIGPTCGCMNLEDAEGEPLSFTATTSVPGGTFEKFEISANGEAPRVISSEGGATPRLELAATPRTGRVTLAITYLKDGDTYTTPGFDVSFCAMDSISLVAGVKDFSFDKSSTARLALDASGKAVLNGQDVSDALVWSLEDMGPATARVPEEETGTAVRLAYEGLPERNDDFGEKTLTARIAQDGCDCKRTRTIRVFHRLFASNHPHAADMPGTPYRDTPNWYYYWMQTPAQQETPMQYLQYHSGTLVDEYGNAVAARYEHESDRVTLTDDVLLRDCKPRYDRTSRALTGETSTGIDCFAETLRHEWQHRTDWLAWWPDGAPGIWSGLDSDSDFDRVPEDVEEKLPGCSDDNERSCADLPPMPAIHDIEINAYWAGWTWPIGSADAEDWACQGKQWEGGTCP